MLVGCVTAGRLSQREAVLYARNDVCGATAADSVCIVRSVKKTDHGYRVVIDRRPPRWSGSPVRRRSRGHVRRPARQGDAHGHRGAPSVISAAPDRYVRQFLAGWRTMDFNGHLANTAYLDLAADVRMAFFAEHGFPPTEFSAARDRTRGAQGRARAGERAAVVRSTGG